MTARFPSVLVKGLAFRPPECKEAASTLAVGDTVYLERDHENAYDQNAIRVLFEGFWIGFVQAEQAAWIGPEMDDDESVQWTGTVTDIKSTAKTIYPVIDISPAEVKA